MKKIYFSLLAAVSAFAVTAQTNPDFENWTSGEADGWTSANAVAALGTASNTPLVQETSGASSGNSYARLNSFTLTGSTNPQVPDGDYGGVLIQNWPSTDKYESFDIDVKYNVGANDEAAIVIVARNSNGDNIGQANDTYSGSQAAWSTETFTMNYTSSDAVTAYDFYIASSRDEILTNSPTPNPNSQLDVDNIVQGAILQDVPLVTNVVATDISDNGDGSDLQVTFDVANDETGVANYHLLVFEATYDANDLANPVGLGTSAGVQLSPNGSSQSHTFAAGDDYFDLNAAGTAFEPFAIAENIPMTVSVVIEGAAGYTNAVVVSNSVTLSSLASTDQIKEVRNIKLFPNPAKSTVTINVDNYEGVEKIVFYNAMGQQVSTNEINNMTTDINVSSFAEGIYTYQVIDSNNEVIKVNRLSVVK